MVKKLLSALLMVLLVLVSPSLVFADLDETNNDNLGNVSVTLSNVTVGDDVIIELNTTIEDNSSSLEEETQEVEVEEVINNSDAEVLSDVNGAKVRLAQLERRIEAQINGANLIIEKLEANNKSVDYERLNEIVKSFELLLVQIDATNYNQDSQSLANEFVVIKSDAIALSNEFRETVKDSLKEAEKAELRNRIETRKAEVYAKHEAKLEELKVKYEAKRVALLAKAYGVSVEELEAKMLSGELTLDEVRAEIRSKYENMSDEQKKVVKQKIAEEAKKTAIEIRQRIDENKEVIKQRNEERREVIKSQIEARREEIKQRAETRKENLEQRREEVKSNIELAREEAKLNREKLREDLKNENTRIESEIEEELNSTQ